ncbi:MAG: glycosyltransferase [Clostridia bacterium]|nr:glycosyltransferase [Clostridia bacterium]
MVKHTVSIIVPVYGVEKYLPACIDSILGQTYMDYELILVDDGSPDDCGRICDEYAGKDERIKVIHKQNGGLADARNAGIRAAEGEFIVFCDSDDTMVDKGLEKVMDYVLDCLPDIVLCSCAFNYEDGTVYERVNVHEHILSGGDFVEIVSDFVNQSIVPWPAWRNVFKRSFLVDNGLWFDTAYTSAEDCDFYFKACSFAKSFGAVDVVLINYTAKRQGSILNTLNCRNIESISAVYKKWQTILKNKYGTKRAASILRCFSQHYYYLVFQAMNQKDNDKLLEICERYKSILIYISGFKKKLVVIMYFLIGVSTSFKILKKGLYK